MFYFAEFHLWGALIGHRPVSTNIEQSIDCVVDVGFRKFISYMKVNRISKLISNVKGVIQKERDRARYLCSSVVSHNNVDSRLFSNRRSRSGNRPACSISLHHVI